MAGKPLSAEQIREILRQHSQERLSNREISRRVSPKVNKETVNHYIGFVRNNQLDIEALLKMDDVELDRVFHKGDPAYTEKVKMDFFMEDIPVFQEERTRPRMTVYRMWRNHRMRHPSDDCYAQAQFFYHLSRANLLPPPKDMPLPNVEKKTVSAIVTIGGCTTLYYNQELQNKETVHFVAIHMISSSYMRIIPVKTLSISEVVEKVHDLLSKIGGVPHILVTDDLRKGCTRPDKSIPAVRTILKDMASYYMYETSFDGGKDAYALARTNIKRAFDHLNHKLAREEYKAMTEIIDDVSNFEMSYNKTRIRKALYSREEDFLKDEQPWLNKLQPEYEIVTTCIHKVNNDGTVQAGKHMGTGFYSVPVDYIGKEVRCIISSKTVTILDLDVLIAEHPRVRCYQYSIKDEHHREWVMSAYNNTLVRLNTASMLMEILGTWMGLYFNEMAASGHRIQECYRRYDNIIRWVYKDTPALYKACEECVRDRMYSYQGLKERYERYHKKE